MSHHDHVNVAVLFRDFQLVNPSYSHVGLGVNAAQTQKVLHKHHVKCSIHGVADSNGIYPVLKADPSITHCLIEAAVWCWENKLAELSATFPNVKFIVRLHSNLAFLQVEPSAFKSLRSTLALQESRENVFLASNSKHLVNWVTQSYGIKALYLPNLYDLDFQPTKQAKKNPQHLQMASYGALRVSKNHVTAAAAAMIIARKSGSKLDFHINKDREEHGKGVLDSLTEMFRDVPGMKLVQDPWCNWEEFRKLISQMDLTLALSHTETFNIVTADSVAEGVPAVVSDCVEWAPENWKCGPDKVEHAAYIGHQLLKAGSVHEGRAALVDFLSDAVSVWLDYLR